MNALKSLNIFLLKYKYLLGLGLLFVITSNIFGLFLPQLFRVALEQLVDYLPFYYPLKHFKEAHFFATMVVNLVFYLSIMILVTTLIRGVLMFFMRQTLIVMSRHIEYEQKNQLYQHYQALTPLFYKRNNTGDLMSRISEDVSRVRMYTGPAIMYIVNLIAMFIMVIYTMFDINAYLSFWVLLPLPLLSYSIFYVSKQVNTKGEKIQKALSDLTTRAQESYSGIRVIQSFARDEQVRSEFESAAEFYRKESLGLARVESFFSPMMLLLVGLSTVLAVYIGGNEVARGRFTPGNIVEFVVYINMLTWPVASLGWAVSLVQRAAASQKRINEFLSTQPDIADTGKIHLDDIQRIEFKNVRFTYPDTGIEALKDVSFTIEKGKKIAVVGKTGSGKSTLAELLMRNYEPDAGSIEVNQHLLKDLSLAGLRKISGYVPQDVFLFSDTVTNNILFGAEENSNISKDDVQKYANIACVHEDVLRLTKGYDTIVGERGVMLSGGQKQRISIARSLIKQPSLVILDDCLSAVDSRTERTILANFESELKDKTVIFITHRLFAAKEMDEILVLDEGRIAERGNHDTLLSKQGIYFELHQLQQQEENEN